MNNKISTKNNHQIYMVDSMGYLLVIEKEDKKFNIRISFRICPNMMFTRA
jgi:hypothetical protein